MRLQLSAAARSLVAVLLVLVLPLSGAGRGCASASTAAVNFTGMICHAHRDAPRDSLPAHDCCGACALCAAAALPDAPDLPAGVRIGYRLVLAAITRPAPSQPRAWTPRLAQGPPA